MRYSGGGGILIARSLVSSPARRAVSHLEIPGIRLNTNAIIMSNKCQLGCLSFIKYKAERTVLKYVSVQPKRIKYGKIHDFFQT
jgi:hypothetical protein